MLLRSMVTLTMASSTLLQGTVAFSTLSDINVIILNLHSWLHEEAINFDLIYLSFYLYFTTFLYILDEILVD